MDNINLENQTEFTAVDDPQRDQIWENLLSEAKGKPWYDFDRKPIRSGISISNYMLKAVGEQRIVTAAEELSDGIIDFSKVADERSSGDYTLPEVFGPFGNGIINSWIVASFPVKKDFIVTTAPTLRGQFYGV